MRTGRRDRYGQGRFIGPFGRGFGVLWNRAGHRFRAYGVGALALLGCWLTILPGYVWIVEPTHALIGAARWSAASLFDQVGLHDWRWTVGTSDGVQRWRAEFIRFDPWHLAQADAVIASLWMGGVIATASTLLLGVLGVAWLRRRGEALSDRRIVRGRRLISDDALASDLRREGVASELEIGKVPLIKGKEAYNILLLGAQGTGKTSVTEDLLTGIEARGEPAVVYDYGPGLLPRFFNARRGDIILNPLDQRSAVWSPWSEINSAADCATVAASFIPQDDRYQPFWGEAGRLLFAEVLDRLREDPERSVTKLLHVLLRMTQEEMRVILAGTNAAKLYQEGGERTGTNVEIHDSIYVKALGLLQANAGSASDFSIQDYVQALDRPAPEHGRPWLWLPTDPKGSTVLKPLLSCWVDAVASALLSLPERPDRRLWFVMDELATLQALPSLPAFLQNCRKRGGVALITLQTPAQPRAIYQEGDAQTILNGCQNQAIFRTPDPEGSAWASRSIGEAEIEELRESTRLSSHGRRGHEVHLSVDRRVSPVVLPSEIATIPDCRCYVKLPDDRPVALTTISPRAPLAAEDSTLALVKRIDFGDTAGEALRQAQVPSGPEDDRSKGSSVRQHKDSPETAPSSSVTTAGAEARDGDGSAVTDGESNRTGRSNGARGKARKQQDQPEAQDLFTARSSSFTVDKPSITETSWEDDPC